MLVRSANGAVRILELARFGIRSCVAEGEGTSEQPRNGEGSTSTGEADFFVPWHVPFHRADAVSALRSGHASQPGSASQPAKGEVDREKGSVVFKRYYHLFEEGELEGLIGAVPCLEAEASFYDKSNWCCIFRRQ